MAAGPKQYLFTSESVERHPDKIADQISDGVSHEQIEAFVGEHFDLRPAAFRQRLDLHRPIYQKTAAYGHFGRDDEDFTWERTDMAAELRAAAGLGELETGQRPVGWEVVV
jgi:S-adenosylmethionine synthetase